MAEKFLTTTDAIALNGVTDTDYAGDPIIIGSGKVLSDADNATYVKPDFRPGGWTVALEALDTFGAADPVTLRLNILCTLQTGDRAEGHVFLCVDPEGTSRVAEFSDGTIAGGGFLIASVAGTSTKTIEVPLDSAADRDAALSALQIGAYLVFDAFTGTPDVSFPVRSMRVNEAFVVVGDELIDPDHIAITGPDFIKATPLPLEALGPAPSLNYRPSMSEALPLRGDNAAFIEVNTSGPRQQFILEEDDVRRKVFYGSQGVVIGDEPEGEAGQDEFADAAPLALGYKSAPTPNIGFTMEIGEPDAEWYYRSAWWTFVAPETQQVRIDILSDLGSDASEVAVFTGQSVDALESIGSGSPELVFDAIAGTTYFIRAYAWNDEDLTYQILLRPFTGEPLQFSGEMMRVDDDRVMYGTGGEYPYLGVMSADEITTQGSSPWGSMWAPLDTAVADIANQRWEVTSAGVSAQGQGLVMANQTDIFGNVVGWYLIPFTLDGVEVATSGPETVFTPTGSPGAIIWVGDDYFITYGHLGDSAQANSEFRLAAYAFDGTRISLSEPIHTSTATAYNPGTSVWEIVVADEDGSFIVAESVREFFSYNPQSVRSHINMLRITFDGTEWTMGPRTVIATSDGAQTSGPLGVQVIPDGSHRVWLDVEMYAGWHENTSTAWDRYAVILSRDFDVLMVHKIPDVSGQGEYSVATDHFGLAVMREWNDEVGDTIPVYTLLQHTIPPEPLRAHHGRRYVEFTVGPRPDPVTQTFTINEGVSPGDVVVLAGAPTIVGERNQWGDGDDATYVELHDGAAKAPLPSTESTGPLVLNVRYSATDATDATGRISFDIRQPDNTVVLYLALDIVIDGTIQQIAYTVTEADYVNNGTTAEAVAALLASGTAQIALSTFQGSTDMPEVTIYETSAGVTYQTEVTTTPNPEPAALIPRGPDDEVHHGYFRINPEERSVSVQVQASSTDPLWLQTWVQYLNWDDSSGTFTPSALHPVGAPKLTQRNVWEPMSLFDDLGDIDATHWMLQIRATTNDPRVDDTPPQPGQKFRADCVFAPDNGLSVADEPYLDGDQPGAMWEGEPHNSTSVYGTPPPINLSEILDLDDELTIPTPLLEGTI